MILDDIHLTILERKKQLPPDSYVASLMKQGQDVILKKVGEEAAEVIIAAKNRDREHMIHEVADLWFHCMVLMAEEGLSHQDILTELEKRYAQKRK